MYYDVPFSRTGGQLPPTYVTTPPLPAPSMEESYDWERDWNFLFVSCQPYMKYMLKLRHDQQCDIFTLNEYGKYIANVGLHGHHDFTPGISVSYAI